RSNGRQTLIRGMRRCASDASHRTERSHHFGLSLPMARSMPMFARLRSVNANFDEACQTDAAQAPTRLFPPIPGFAAERIADREDDFAVARAKSSYDHDRH